MYFSYCRLLRRQTSKYKDKNYICNMCLAHFTVEERLNKHIPECSQRVVYVPTEDKSCLSFENYARALDVPFVVYADSECVFQDLETCIPDPNKSSTTLMNKHTPYAFAYYIKCSFNSNLDKFKKFKGLDSPKQFIRELVSDIIEYYNSYLKEVKPMIPLNAEEISHFSAANICHICNAPFINEVKVRDHCHLSGKYRGAAHNACNLNYNIPKFFPVIFHNFSSYDCHLFVRELNNIDDGSINVIPLNKELYISLSKYVKNSNGDRIEIRFLDSCRFMPSSLDNLVKNLTKQDLKIVKSFCDDTKFNFLIRKGVFPYSYLNCVEKLKEVILPNI